MKIIHLLCASTSSHIFCIFKNVSVFPRVEIYARRTSDQRQFNVSHKYSTRFNSFVVFSLIEVCPSRTYMAHSPRMKNKKIKIVSGLWKMRRVDNEFTARC